MQSLHVSCRRRALLSKAAKVETGARLSYPTEELAQGSVCCLRAAQGSELQRPRPEDADPEPPPPAEEDAPDVVGAASTASRPTACFYHLRRKMYPRCIQH